jgi:hypothetical protein
VTETRGPTTETSRSCGNSGGGGLRARTNAEYKACVAQADGRGKDLLIQGSIEQVVGIAFTEFGLYAAVEAVPSLNNTFFKGMKLEHLFDFAHGGSIGYFGAVGPVGVGLVVFGKGTLDVRDAYDQFNREVTECAGPVPVTP